jgi:hypothetical protein
MDVDRAMRLQRDWDERGAPGAGCCRAGLRAAARDGREAQNGQTDRVVRFLASTFNGELFPLDPFELRAVDVEVSDDTLVCLDALRWGKPDLHHLVPDGQLRVCAVLTAWGIDGLRDRALVDRPPGDPARAMPARSNHRPV